MTLQNIFECLQDIDRDAQTLIRNARFSYDAGLSESVCINTDDPEHLYLQEAADCILGNLASIHEDLLYLRRPFRGEYKVIATLDGRIGYSDRGRLHVFHCGDDLEVKTTDGLGRLRWIRSSVEHDGSRYYLVGCRHYPAVGCTIRIKEGMS
ncbi:MAG: DUF5348 domain-containing protein [Lachnospiraceae bacterium]|nr:DUF5348 domain-containing protein [Lachnospiraceae bacterium]